VTRRDIVLGGMAAAAAVGASRTAAAAEPLVQRLGHPKDARLLMIHADDVGMSHSVNAASSEAMLKGMVSSSSVMVPCPWFPETARWSREHPEADLGLHLTLTSEWAVYRWRPVAPQDQVKSLMDDEGFMWRSVEQVVKNAVPAEVERELRAQIERARRFGMKPTHVDSHMGTLFADPRFFEIYTRVAKETGIIPMLPGPTPEILEEAKGFLILDRLVTTLNARTLPARKEEFRELVRGLRPGVTELIVHLSGDDAEIRHITGNWERRYHDYQIVMDPELKAFVRAQGVQLVGYRPLDALWKRG
jgi:chitin disaccharide deacetylase